jgi:hypothetical protein
VADGQSCDSNVNSWQHVLYQISLYVASQYDPIPLDKCIQGIYAMDVFADSHVLAARWLVALVRRVDFGIPTCTDGRSVDTSVAAGVLSRHSDYY